MTYKRETIVNIGALESAINFAYIDAHNLRVELEKESPNPDRVRHFLKSVEQSLLTAKDFQFLVEIREITDHSPVTDLIQQITSSIKKGFFIRSDKCGRDANGVFHCECGKCQKSTCDTHKNQQIENSFGFSPNSYGLILIFPTKEQFKNAKLAHTGLEIIAADELKDFCWFNFYQPKHGYSPIAYDFGNGAGGHADVLCANIGCANVECSRIDCSGQIVGGNTFVDYLQSNGDGYFSGNGTFNGNVTAKSRIVAGGTNYWTDSVLSVNGIATAHSWDVVSDPDLKTNIVKQDGLKALGKISKLKFYSYDLRAEISNSQNAHTDIGLMADEAPTEIQSSDGKGIDLYAYISLTAKAVQELTAKIDTLEQKIVELEAENQALKQ